MNQPQQQQNEEQQQQRRKPNILITGTPGVGKTATATLLAERFNFQHFDIGSIIERNKYHLEYDETLETFILDEDKLLDHLESEFEEFHKETEEEDESDDDVDGMVQEVDMLGTTKNNDGKYNGIVVDYHSCNLFPERWFDLVLVLRADTHVLYDRLVKRGYSEIKRNQNMECEIMRVLIEEAKESYDKEIVHELQSNTIKDIETTTERVEVWYKQWMKDNNS